MTVTWQTQEQRKTRFIGRGRGGPDRPTREVVSCWYVIAAVTRNVEAIAQRKAELGWRVQATKHPTARALLNAIERMTIILTVMQLGQTRVVHITPLPPLLIQLLSYLGLPASLYTDLTQNE